MTETICETDYHDRIVAELRAAGAVIPPHAEREVASAAFELSMTPEGGWPETRQKENQLSECGYYDATRSNRWQPYATPEQARAAVDSANRE